MNFFVSNLAIVNDPERRAYSVFTPAENTLISSHVFEKALLFH